METKITKRHVWNKADLAFIEKDHQKGSWDINNSTLENWTIQYPLPEDRLKLLLKPSSSKHVGVFPEQAVNWDYVFKHCTRISRAIEKPKVLNLFAYTGAASIVASKAGASVTHVDSTASVVQWGKRNAELNNITNIRWIVEGRQKIRRKVHP